MGNPFIGRTSRTAAGWIFAAVFFGWVAFVVFVDPRPKPEPPPWKPPPPKPRLAAYGLPENPDLDAMPELFRIWQGEADWVRDRTTFAFWNPGDANYSYTFEAQRKGNSFIFRAIELPFGFDPSLADGEATPPEHPLRFIRAKRFSGPITGIGVPPGSEVVQTGPQEWTIVPLPINLSVPKPEPIRPPAVEKPELNVPERK
ncbi:MAG TPA: hypothetical protein VHD32_12380 [Candidatus Didemnitutus sp.]|nr:hypothetical protein [Candidatus Didemnitutus sp.]